MERVVADDHGEKVRLAERKREKKTQKTPADLDGESLQQRKGEKHCCFLWPRTKTGSRQCVQYYMGGRLGLLRPAKFLLSQATRSQPLRSCAGPGGLLITGMATEGTAASRALLTSAEHEFRSVPGE